MSLRTNQLSRQEIGKFIGTERGVRAFEDVQADLSDQFAQIAGASFVTLGQEPSLGSERVLAPVPGELEAQDGGANGLYSLGLADVGVAGEFGDDNGYPVITLDDKGRVIAVSTRPNGGIVTTVAALPSASVVGAGVRAFVTDANATTFLSVAAGGGVNKVPVVSDGTNWLIG